MDVGGNNVLIAPPTHRTGKVLRAGFWLSSLSLTSGVTFLVSLPTLRMTSSQIMPWLFLGGISSITALTLCGFGKGRVTVRLAAILLAGLSLAVWAVLVWANAIMSGQFVR